MKRISAYLDEAASTKLVKNDSELARRLGVTRQSVSAWRNGESAPNEDQAAALAALLGKPEVLAECMAARAKKPENRRMWEKAAKALSMATAFCIVGAVVLQPSGASAKPLPRLGSVASAFCVMLSRARRRLRPTTTRAYVPIVAAPLRTAGI